MRGGASVGAMSHNSHMAVISGCADCTSADHHTLTTTAEPQKQSTQGHFLNGLEALSAAADLQPGSLPDPSAELMLRASPSQSSEKSSANILGSRHCSTCGTTQVSTQGPSMHPLTRAV
eukprot:1195926-Pleurochrysis_carterae.AAC.2